MGLAFQLHVMNNLVPIYQEATLSRTALLPIVVKLHMDQHLSLQDTPGYVREASRTQDPDPRHAEAVEACFPGLSKPRRSL